MYVTIIGLYWWVMLNLVILSFWYAPFLVNVRLMCCLYFCGKNVLSVDYQATL
jgi:hypothetical protein